MPDQSSAATEHAIIQEITRPLDHLPDDPMEVVNAEFPTALRGYDRVAVDDYVRHTRQLVAELQATRSPEAAVRRALERVGEQISGILQRAHETAESITAQSRVEAEDRLEQAREEAAQIIRAAEQRVHDLDADTDRIWLERQRIVADAEDLAAQLHSVARSAAERFPEDGEPDGRGEESEEFRAPEPPEDEPELVSAAEPSAEPVTAEAPFDGETTAETAQHPMSGVEEPELEQPEDIVDQDDAMRQERSEVEQTMAFRPLTPDGGGGAISSEPSRGDPEASDPDATQIIPPSSQAASRRHEH